MAMKLAAVVATAVAIAIATLPGAAEGDSYVPWPHDGRPSWSPDGKRIAFLTTREGRGLAVVGADGSGERRLLDDVERAVLSRNWEWIAFTRGAIGGGSLWIARGDGSDARLLAGSSGATPAWSPDSRRIAFVTAAGSVSVIDPDGGELTPLAESGSSPAWSPDGSRIAFTTGGPDDRDLYVVGSAGGKAKLVAGGPRDQLAPQWSPDGTRIAFLVPSARGVSFYRLGVVRPDGSGLRVFRTSRVGFDSGEVSWMPDSRRLVYASEIPRAVFQLDLPDGRIRRLTGGATTPSPSPDGRRIAFAAGGECRDRLGIYVSRSDGKLLRRLTNGCRVFGTPADDELRGTKFVDILLGLGGDDRLFASWGDLGDVLVGGDGDDLLVGELRNDLLRAGPGSDHLKGGVGRDVLFGGPGRDRIDAGRGRDVVYARDGESDTIACGTKSGGEVERDRVWADRHDRVAPDCDIVHRPRR